MAASHLRPRPLGPRPLDRVRSIKVKLGLVVVGSAAATVGAIYASVSFGFHARIAFAGGLVVSLVVIQLHPAGCHGQDIRDVLGRAVRGGEPQPERLADNLRHRLREVQRQQDLGSSRLSNP